MADLLAQVATALVWLTRLPVGRMRQPLPALATAVWAFPLAGLVVGLCGGAVALACNALGLPLAAAALLAIGTCILLTGGLHEDGLADFVDGFGGATRARALEIMRDSRIGSYGVLALGIATGLRVVLLAAMMQVSAWYGLTALVAAAALSRAGMAVGLAGLPPARSDGLGHLAGRSSRMAVLPALMLGVLALSWPALLSDAPLRALIMALLLGGVAQFVIARNAQRRLGGQTGDVLGAMQQVGEIGVLMGLAAHL